MAKKRSTPEEQLLNLIEKEGEPTAARFKRRKRFFLSFSSLKGFIFFFGRGITRRLGRLKKGLREPNLKVLNKIFLVISCGLIVYSVMNFVFNSPDIEEFYRKSRLIKKERAIKKTVKRARPFLHHLEMVRRRNIFSPITLKKAEKAEVKKEDLQKMTKDLDLVGISWGEEPVAMIEDRKTEKTYFLKKGEKIDRFKIEDILKNRIILSFEGKQIELI